MSKMSVPKLSEADREKARQRFQIMMQVESGQMTATDAAEALGISRMTFYEWQNAALTATLDALTDGVPGRPKISQQVAKIKALEAELEKTQKALEKSEILSELKGKVIAIRESQLAERQKKTGR
ncbi:MAG: helix-turn-helix domain-containing protein [Candidatus Izemoplasmatales bacterium]|jgi:transposase